MTCLRLIFILTLLTTLNVTKLSAQKITVTEASKMMSQGSAPAMCVSIYRVDEKTVLKDFSKYLSRYKASTSTKKGELQATQVRIKELSVDSLILYANTESVSKNEVRLLVFVQQRGQWLTLQSPINQYLSKDLYNYAISESQKPIEKSIKEVNKTLRQKQKEQSSIQSENKKLNKQNDQYKKDIKKNEETVSDNETYLNTLQKDLEDLKKQLTELQEQLKSIK